MTELNPEAADLPLPDHVVEAGEALDPAKAALAEAAEGTGEDAWIDPVTATAPVAAPAQDDEAEAGDDQPGGPFPVTGPLTGTAVPPGSINPQ